jgi:hypothetical protein
VGIGAVAGAPELPGSDPMASIEPIAAAAVACGGGERARYACVGEEERSRDLSDTAGEVGRLPVAERGSDTPVRVWAEGLEVVVCTAFAGDVCTGLSVWIALALWQARGERV